MADRVGQQLGNYRLVRLLGHGSFAEVYLGEHIYLKTQAAVKVLPKQVPNDDMERFLSEARRIARLKHPNIVRLLEFGVEESTPILVMAYAPNGSLRQQHAQGVLLAPATIVSYVKQIVAGLQYAHEQKLIHRDIKPENMLLGRRNELLLSDFGTAVVTQSSHYQDTQQVGASVLYIAPEQLQGKPCPASDQYALGVVVYEWLCGECPFHGSFSEITDQHVSAPPPPLREKVPTISPDVEQVVLTALAKDPQRRFASVTAFARALEEASTPELPTLTLASANSLPLSESKQDSAQRSSPAHKQETLAAVAQLQEPRRPSGRIITVLILLVLLIIGGGGLTYYTTVFYPASLRAQATASVQMMLTEQANARADATFTAMTPQEIYHYATGGRPVINDPLSNQNASAWENNKQGCAFIGGAYHVQSSANQSTFCLSQGSNFGNFAFQVQMTIVQGEVGGIFFRADSQTSKYYYFSIDLSRQDYYLALDENGTEPKQVTDTFQSRLNQPDLIAVVAYGENFYIYVNKQYVTSMNDRALHTGAIGVFAMGEVNSTEVVFRNAQAWVLT